MAAERKHQLEVAAVAGHVAVELALVADAKSTGPIFPPMLRPARNVPFFCAAEMISKSFSGSGVNPPWNFERRCRSDTISKVHLWNHAAHLRRPLDPAGEEAVLRLDVDRQAGAVPSSSTNASSLAPT